jgi:hypothetical protein
MEILIDVSFFDSNGDFIENYYLIGLLSEQLLKLSPGDSIVHDPRLVWNTVEKINIFGGIPYNSQSLGIHLSKKSCVKITHYMGEELSGNPLFQKFFFQPIGE